MPIQLLPLFAEGGQMAFLSEVVVLLAASALIAYLCQRFGLVPIVGFLLAGVVIGPYALGLVRDRALIDATAEIGIILLLFTIGLEFSLEKLSQIRRFIFLGGGMQVGLVILVTTALLAAFGIDWRAGVFTGFLIALSSTAIVLKLLADRGDTNTTGGQISLGVLIFQDLAIIVMALLVPMLGGGGGSSFDVAVALGTAALLIIVVLLVARRIMPPILEMVARTCSPELFLLTVIAICFGTAYLTSLFGVSLSLGAFLAGLIVSESRYSEQAFGEILPLQILFSATFFVSVGMLLDLRFLIANPLLVVAVVAGVLLLKLLTTGLSVKILGYPAGTAAVSAFLLAQVGEFSFVLERIGRDAGIFPFGMETTGGQTFIAASVVLMVLTPFLALAGYRVEAILARRAPASGSIPTEESASSEHFAHLENHVIIAGYGDGGRQIASMLAQAGVPFVIVTLSPGGASAAEAAGYPVLLGDDSRIHTLNLVRAPRARMLIIADDTVALARRTAAVARMANPTLTILVRTRYTGDIEELHAVGADTVVSEELESTARLAEHVLFAYQLRPDQVAAFVATLRAHDAGALPAQPSNIPGAGVDTRAATIRAGAPAAGQPLAALALTERYGVQLDGVRRDGVFFDAPADLTLTPGDQVLLRGTAAQFEALAELLRPADAQPPDEPPAGAPECSHLGRIVDVTPNTEGCEECLASGDRWVHLRMCLTCGHVGCCDSSKGKHATKHFHATGHPIMRSMEPGEEWRWCFIDQQEV
jgi:CPA2 family monovalent cation:H+ antiporter-2